jgi:hypothetical protein
MIPDVATRKLAALTQQTSDAQALREAAKRQVSDAERRVQVLINSKAGEVELAKAAEQVERARDLMVVRHRLYEEAQGLVTKLQSWLNETARGLQLEPAPTPQIENGGNPTVLIGELRSRIAELVAAFWHVKRAPAPLDDAKRQVRELVAALAEKGKPAVDIRSGTLQVKGWTAAEEHSPTFHSRTIATLCWLMPDVVIERLDEIIAPLADADALPHDQRKERLAELEQQIQEAELAEEAIITKAHADGVVIPRRHDQGAASILGVRIVEARAAA